MVKFLQAMSYCCTVIQLIISYREPFSAWLLLKGHAYLNKPAVESSRFVEIGMTF